MVDLATIQERIKKVGLAGEEKYRFLLGPLGLLITLAEKAQLEEIGRAALEYIRLIDEWYRRAKKTPAGSWLVSVLNAALPKGSYRSYPHGNELPHTFMVDTIWTSEGWRVVEVDVTNRNAMGYPLIMRYLYDLPSVWEGIDKAWLSGGWSGVTQVMASHHRFYEPYFRFFLGRINGALVSEGDLGNWLAQTPNQVSLLDLPILYKSKPHLQALFSLAAESRIAIPPKHYLSSKALMTLPWEMNLARGNPLADFLPEGRMLRRWRKLPTKDFFVKLLQSGGAHGTFYNDQEKLRSLYERKKPVAIWQHALPITPRVVSYLDDGGKLTEGEFYVRVSIFVNLKGEVVDADATCSPEVIVHGAKRAVMTVPVLL